MASRTGKWVVGKFEKNQHPIDGGRLRRPFAYLPAGVPAEVEGRKRPRDKSEAGGPPRQDGACEEEETPRGTGGDVGKGAVAQGPEDLGGRARKGGDVGGDGWVGGFRGTSHSGTDRRSRKRRKVNFRLRCSGYRRNLGASPLGGRSNGRRSRGGACRGGDTNPSGTEEKDKSWRRGHRCGGGQSGGGTSRKCQKHNKK